MPAARMQEEQRQIEKALTTDAAGSFSRASR